MLLILFWISFLMFNVSYLFTVVFLALMILILMLCWMSNMIYLKYLVVVIYISGVVVFVLYISSMCWFMSNKFTIMFMFLGFFFCSLYDLGLMVKILDVGEYLWMFLFFSLIFGNLANTYSFLLFKVTGSLRF